MASEHTVVVPALAENFESGTLVAWHKAVGDPVSAGDVLAEIMTDKINLEIECPYDGVMKQLLVQEDEVVAVGQDIAVVGSAG